MMANRRFHFTLGLDRFSGLYLWALFIITFSVLEPRLFPTASTVHSVASAQAISGVLALAVMVPLIAGAYDLSVGAVANLSTIVVVWLQTDHRWSMWEAILVTVALSLAVGVVNAIVVVRLKVNSFIATLGAASFLVAFQTIVSGNALPFPVTSIPWTNLTQRSVGGFQIVVVYLIVIALFLWVLVEKTPGGRYMRAAGANPDAARLAGVRVGKWVGLSLMISSLLSGIAGIFFASLLGPSLTYGQGFLLPAFAAAFLGSTQIRAGAFNVWGTMIALFTLATGVKGLQLVTGVQWLNDMFNGMALIAAVAFAGWRQRAANRRVRLGEPAPTSTNDDERDLAGVAGEVATAQASTADARVQAPS